MKLHTYLYLLCLCNCIRNVYSLILFLYFKKNEYLYRLAFCIRFFPFFVLLTYKNKKKKDIVICEMLN